MGRPRRVTRYCSSANIRDLIHLNVAAATPAGTSQIGGTTASSSPAAQATDTSGNGDASQGQTGDLAKKRKASETSESQTAKESRKISKIGSSPLQDHPDSEVESVASNTTEDEEENTDMDEYEDSDGDFEKRFTNQYNYVIEKTCGCAHYSRTKHEKPVVTTAGTFHRMKDANERARSYLKKGLYDGVKWDKWEDNTGENGLVRIFAKTLHHWYRIQVLVHQKTKENAEPPYVYVVEEEANMCVVFKPGDNTPVPDCDLITRLGIFRDRRSANAFVKEKVEERFHHEGKEAGYTRGKSMVRGLLEITDTIHNTPDTEGESFIMRAKRVPLL